MHFGKIGKVVSHAVKGVEHAVSHAAKHISLGDVLFGLAYRPAKSLLGEVGKFLHPKPQPQPAPDDSTANALLSLGQQMQTQQQQQQIAQQQAQQQQIQAAQAAQQAQEQARQDALRRKKMSSLLATSPTGLPDTLLGSAASLYGKSTLGA